MKTVSMKGKQVDFAYYMDKHGDDIALGSAMLNARGDQLNARGEVVQTRAEIAAEYHRNTKSVKQVSIKALDSEMFQSPAEAVKKLEETFKQNQKAKMAAAEEKFAPKRKISDSEE